MMIVFVVNVIIFQVMNLPYAVILAFFSGVSVLIPYIGVLMVSIPVALIAYFEFGLAPDFAYLMVAYGIVMVLDGNVLVPLLFSEVTNLHPIAIIAAVLIFGGIWGVLGVFFSIPLATVVQAILSAWPVVDKSPTNTSAEL